MPSGIKGLMSIPLNSKYSIPSFFKRVAGREPLGPDLFGLTVSYNSFSICKIPVDICCGIPFSSSNPISSKRFTGVLIPLIIASINSSKLL